MSVKALSTGYILETILSGMKTLLEPSSSESSLPKNPYAAALLGSVCIELMGRCLYEGDDWMSDSLDATQQFNNALTDLDGLSNYNNVNGLWKYEKMMDARLSDTKKELLNKEPIVSVSAQYESAKKEASQKMRESKKASAERDELYEKLNELRSQAGLPTLDKGFSLFKALRCGFAHTCRPQEGLLLTNSIDYSNGVVNDGNSVVLGVQQLYENLIKAKEDLKKKGKHYSDAFIYVTENNSKVSNA